METNGFTLKFYLLGHGSGECYFPQRADMVAFLSAVSYGMVRYTVAPGDYRGKLIPDGIGRSYKGAEAEHYS